MDPALVVVAAAQHHGRQTGARLVGLEPLTGGSSAETARADFISADGRDESVLLRLHRAVDFKDGREVVVAKEFRVLENLSGRGLAVPRPISVIELEGSPPCLVLEWIEGSTTVSADALPAALDQMAEFLVELHGAHVDAQVPELEPIDDPRSGVVAFLPDSPTGKALRQFLDQGTLDLVANPAAIVHGDFWPGNVVWRDGRLAAVIDWEDACWGDPLADLATARVELLCLFGPEAMESFTSRFLDRSVRAGRPLDTRSLPSWACYVSAAALASMHQWGLSPDELAQRFATTEQFFDDAVAELLARR